MFPVHGGRWDVCAEGTESCDEVGPCLVHFEEFSLRQNGFSSELVYQVSLFTGDLAERCVEESPDDAVTIVGVQEVTSVVAEEVLDGINEGVVGTKSRLAWIRNAHGKL